MCGWGGVHWPVYHGTCIEVRGQLYGVGSVLLLHVEVPRIKLGPLRFCQKQYLYKVLVRFLVGHYGTHLKSQS